MHIGPSFENIGGNVNTKELPAWTVKKLGNTEIEKLIVEEEPIELGFAARFVNGRTRESDKGDRMEFTGLRANLTARDEKEKKDNAHHVGKKF